MKEWVLSKEREDENRVWMSFEWKLWKEKDFFDVLKKERERQLYRKKERIIVQEIESNIEKKWVLSMERREESRDRESLEGKLCKLGWLSSNTINIYGTVLRLKTADREREKSRAKQRRE